MAYAAVETNVLTSPEGRRLSASAKLLWLAGRLHCAEYETDGLIEASALPLLVYASGAEEPVEDLIAELVQVGWWQHDQLGVRDVHFLKSNAAHEVRERRRAADAEKKRRLRVRGVPEGQPRGTSPRAVPLGRPPDKRRGEESTAEHVSGDKARTRVFLGTSGDMSNGSGPDLSEADDLGPTGEELEHPDGLSLAQLHQLHGYVEVDR